MNDGFPRMFRGMLACTVIGVASVLGLLPAAEATLIEDYFHYGDTTMVLDNLGAAGGGWTGAWTRRNATYCSANYLAGGRLSFNNSDYKDVRNPPDSGGATRFASGNNVHPAGRTLEPTGTGTTWISLLVQFGNIQLGSYSNIFGLWLNPTGSLPGSNSSVGFWNGHAELRLGGTTTQVPLNLNVNETYLMLARLTVDGAGTDALDMWFKSESDDISSILTLGSPDASLSGIDAFGPLGLTSVAIGFHGPTPYQIVDALRISNDPNGLHMVTAFVPEPGSLALLGLAGLLALRRSRKSL